jgi:hypothetical protein
MEDGRTGECDHPRCRAAGHLFPAVPIDRDDEAFSRRCAAYATWKKQSFISASSISAAASRMHSDGSRRRANARHPRPRVVVRNRLCEDVLHAESHPPISAEPRVTKASGYGMRADSAAIKT